jgi:hypothetical protein
MATDPKEKLHGKKENVGKIETKVRDPPRLNIGRGGTFLRKVGSHQQGYTAGVPKLFWFKTPLTLKIFHAPPPSTVLGNQVTNCNK